MVATSNVTDLYITASDAASRLGVSEAWVRKLFRRGQLDGARKGRWMFIDPVSVERYLTEHRGQRRKGPSPNTLARAMQYGIVGEMR